MSEKARKATTTITLSVPARERKFFDDLAEDGYNRSQLMLKMIRIMESLYVDHGTFPGGLPKAIDHLYKLTKAGAIMSYDVSALNTPSAKSEALSRY